MTTPFNAGLPQPAAQYGGMPIGATMLAPYGGPVQTLGDGTIWLRAGAMARASAYPDAAKLSHMRGHFTPKVTFPGTLTTTGCDIATDGAGTYVAVLGAGTSAYRSTDYGKTWAAVAHNLNGGINPVSVAYGNGRFVIVGNDASTYFVSVSTDGGASFAIQNLVALALTSSTAGTAKIVWTGSRFVLAANQNGVTNAVLASITALTGSWTSVASISTGTSFSICHSGSLVLITQSNGGTGAQKSTDGGITFSSISLPNNSWASAHVFASASGRIVVPISPTQYIHTTDFTNWTLANFLFQLSGTARFRTYVDSKGRTIAPTYSAGGGFIYTSDVSGEWEYQGVSEMGVGDNTISIVVEGGKMFWAGGQSGAAYYGDTNIDSANGVGRPIGSYVYSAQINSPYAYQRIK